MFNLYLDNYRSFLKQDFKFSRYNILIGENSSGKSSVLKFLLMLKQSFRKPYQLNLVFKDNDFIDLGKYSDIIYKHEDERDLSFAFEFHEDYNDFFGKYMTDIKTDNKEVLNEQISRVKNFFENMTNKKVHVSITLNKEVNSHKIIKTIIKNDNIGTIEIVIKENRQEVEPGESPKVDIIFKSNQKEEILLENIGYSKHSFLTLLEGKDLNRVIESKYPERKDLFYQLAYLIISQNYIIHLIDDIQYINPMDSNPQRIYVEDESKGFTPVRNLKDVVNILTDDFIKKESRDFFLDKLKQTLNEFGIVQDLRIQKGETVSAIELQAKTIGSNVWCNIIDVGYGLSVQIPIFFQAIISESFARYKDKPGEIILIEQPEIHIHPKLHAKFIETLIKISENNKYLIETHSEHLIRMLQVLVKSKKIKTSDVAIYYFQNGDEKSNVTKHEIGENGILSPSLPENFFDNSYTLSLGLLN